MTSFAEFTKKKKKKSAEGQTFADYTRSLLGDDVEIQDIAPIRQSVSGDDIAPKSDEEKKSLFGDLEFIKKDTLFSDGYQRGDVIKSVGANVGKLATGVAKGALGLGEGISDAILYGVSGVSKLAGADKFAENVKKEAQVNATKKLFQPVDDYLDKYSTFGKTLDAVNQGIGQVGTLVAGGALLKGAGMAAKGISAVTQGTLGVSTFGSGMSEAYEGGATDSEALTYGATTGASAVLTEMLFGGLGKAVNAVGFSKGLSQLDDVLAQKVTGNINNVLARNLASYGIKAGAEGFEEVIDGIVNIAAKKLTYMSEEDVRKIVEDQNLLEQFVVGAATSGVMQSGIIPGTRSGSLIEANKAGRDFITGYTKNEQSVIDKEVENRIAEREVDGKKLTNKEKSTIKEQVQKDLEKGYISVDTIEGVLGGKTYSGYKSITDRETSIKKEIETLENKTESLFTHKDSERLT